MNTAKVFTCISVLFLTVFGLNITIESISVIDDMDISSSLSVDIFNAYAEEYDDYKMLEGVHPILTFTFRDGVEIHEFPFFKMGENLVSNSETTFTVSGAVENSPLLYEAMDEAYKYRFSSTHEYSLKYFDVEVSFVKDGEFLRTLEYSNCRIDNHKIQTLYSGDYESYFDKPGFVLIDNVDFQCSGVNPKSTSAISMDGTNDTFTEHLYTGYNFANNVKTAVTFEFVHGVEKIEFPVFTLVQGYEESIRINGVNVPLTPEFKVEGVLDNYPLLFDAIDNSIRLSGIQSSSNTDFDATVEFINEETVLRGFEFVDCFVSGSLITTQSDKEESFTGESGFAIVHEIIFNCAGLNPINIHYNDIRGDVPIWNHTNMLNTYEEFDQNYSDKSTLLATFTYPDGIEIVEFPIFEQDNVLKSSEDINGFINTSNYPTFKLQGIVGDYPMLYEVTDYNRSMNGVGGTHSKLLFDVDVDLISGENILRSFHYNGCRVIDYTVETNTGMEESYIGNKFALESIFNFECIGYDPVNPIFDEMYVVPKADLVSTKDLKSTHTWKPGFSVK